MSDPFTEVAPTQTSDPFAQVPVQPPAPVPEPQGTVRQGAIGAIASVNPSASFEEVMQMYVQANAGYQSAIATGQDVLARQRLATEQQQRDVDALLRLHRGPNPEADLNLQATTAAAMAQAQINVQRRAEESVERQAIENIQDIAARGDMTQARLLFRNLRNGDANQVLRDINTRRMILQRELENAQVRNDEQPWYSHLLNFAIQTIPFRNTAVRNGIIPVEESMTHWYDWLMGGERLQNQREALWQLPPDQFAETVRLMIPRIRDRAQLFGWQNRSQEFSILSGLVDSPSAFETNAWDLLDNVGWVPLSPLAKAASLPATLLRLGARAERGALISAAAEAVARGGPDAARALGVTTDDIARDVLTGIVNPLGTDATVGLSGDIAANLVRVRTLLEETIPAIMTRRFTTEEERQAAIQAAQSNLARQIGRDVKDVTIEQGETRLLSASPVDNITFTVGPRSGGLYATERSARRAAQNMNFQAELLEVGGRSAEPVAEPAARAAVEGGEVAGSRSRTITRGDGSTYEINVPEGQASSGGSTRFTTARGSTYEIHPDGTTSRNKAGGHPDGGVGPQPRSQRTFYVSQRQANLLGEFQAQGGPRVVLARHMEPGGIEYWGVRYVDGKDAGKFERRTVVAIQNQPRPGLIPVEVWDDGARVHFGNKITSVGGADDSVAAGSVRSRQREIIDGEGNRSTIDVPDTSAPTATIVRDQSGGYAIKIRMNVRETGHYTNPNANKTTNSMWGFLLNPSHTGDEIMDGLAQAAGGRRNKIITGFAKEREEAFRGLSADSRNSINQILLKGGNEARWFNEEELHQIFQQGLGRNATAKEIVAYQTAREINDAEYILRNEEMWASRAIRGYESISFDAGMAQADRLNGLVDIEMKRPPGGPIFDMSSRTMYNKNNPLTPARLEELRDSGHVLVTLETGITLPDGHKVRSFIARNGQITREPLRLDQLSYRPGGHRIYREKYFSKQTVRGTQPDGESFFDNPVTHIVGTKAEVDAWNSTMEQARLAFKANRPRDEIADILGQRPNLPTIDDFMDQMENPRPNGFQPDEAFETLYDRQNPTAYQAARTSPYDGDFVDQDADGIVGYLRNNGRLYYSRKGEHLPDWQGGSAPTLDSFKTINQSLMNVASLSSFSDFKNSAIERWANTYGSLIDQNTLPRDASNWYKFSRGVINRGGDERLRQAAENQRAIVQRILGWKTEADFQAAHRTQQVANWIMGHDPSSIRHTVGKVVTDWWVDRNPIRAARGFAVDLKLGWFNPAQFPLQASTMIASMSLSPRLGMKGMMSYMPMRFYLRKGATTADLDMFIARGAHTAAGLEPEEFRAYMNSARNSGFFDFKNNHLMMEEYGPNAAIPAFRNNYDRFSQAGRVFWNEGEMINRGVSYRIAWGEARQLHPTAAFNDPYFQRDLARLANKYSFQMSEQSAAYWQKGILSIPTQFWSYNVRMMEMMMGNDLTPIQRVRLVVGQTLLAGSAGFPLGSVAAVWYQWATGHPPGGDTPMSDIVGILDRGLVDTAIYHASGQTLDAHFGQRLGSAGNFLPDLVRDVMGWSQYGERTAVDIALGAGGSTLGSIFAGLVDIARYSAAESGGDQGWEMTTATIGRLAQNVSSISNASKAYMILRYQEYMTSRGNVVLNDVPTVNAFAMMLGFTPGQLNNLSAATMRRNAVSEQVDDAVRVIRQYRARWYNEVDNRDGINQEINAYTRLLPPLVRAEALRRAHSTTEPSLYSNVARQMQQREADEAAIRELEQRRQGQ